MDLSVRQLLAVRNIHPTEEHLAILESKWAELRARKGDLDGIALDDADIALRNIPGGDHVRR